MDPSDPDAAAGTPIPGLNITLANIQEALRRGRSQSAENMVKTVEGLENRLVGGGNGGAAAQVIWLTLLIGHLRSVLMLQQDTAWTGFN